MTIQHDALLRVIPLKAKRRKRQSPKRSESRKSIRKSRKHSANKPLTDNGGNYRGEDVANIIQGDDWRHVIAILDRVDIKINVDGVEVTDTTPISNGTVTTISDPSNPDLIIGSLPGQAKYFNGGIDDLRVYDRH